MNLFPKYRVIVIGLGRIGCTYDLHDYTDTLVMTHAKSCSTHQSFELVAGVDPSTSNKTTFHARYKVPTFSSLEEVPTSLSYDVAIVCCPTQRHTATIEFLLRLSRKPRLILCEKPISFQLSEIEAINTLSIDSGVPILVNYIRRALPENLEIANEIESRKIKLPVNGFFWYSSGLLNSASHMIDLCQFWFGPLQSIECIFKRHNSADYTSDFRVYCAQAEITFLYSHYAHPFELTGMILSPTGLLKYERCGEFIAWHDLVPDPHGNGYSEPSRLPRLFSTNLSVYQHYVLNEIQSFLETGSSMLPLVSDLIPMHRLLNNCITRSN